MSQNVITSRRHRHMSSYISFDQ